MSFQAAYDAVRNWLGLSPTEHVIITVEPVVSYQPIPINQFDFRGGREVPKPVERKAEPMRVANVRVKVVKPTTKPPKPKRGAKKKKP